MATVNNDYVPQSVLDSVNTRTVSEALEGSVEEITDRFLKLLVAQMTNQDPMNPLDNAQVTSQLAQLSTVSGITKMNETMESFKESLYTNQALQSANMIGHGVLVPGDTMQLYEGVAVFGVDLPAGVDTFTARILDSRGNLVHSMEFTAGDAGVFPIAWDGTVGQDANGDPVKLPDGQYRFQVSAGTGLSFGEVDSVTRGGSGVTLNISGLGEVDFASVRQIL